MVTNAAMQVLGVPPDAQLIERLRGQFTETATGPRHILAQGTHAAEALRMALAGDIASIVLLAPPAVETLDAELIQQQTPVLALFGTEMPTSMAGAWRRALPKAFITFVFGATDRMAMERPQAVAALTADFFARGENFLVKATEDRLYA